MLNLSAAHIALIERIPEATMLHYKQNWLEWYNRQRFLYPTMGEKQWHHKQIQYCRTLSDKIKNRHNFRISPEILLSYFMLDKSA